MPPPFSDEVMRAFSEPKNVGDLSEPYGEGVAGSMARGVFMQIHVRVVDHRVVDARYRTYGCVPAIAAGTVVTEWVRGRSTDEALAFTPAQLTSALGGLPRERRFCSDLAVEALRSAVRNAMDTCPPVGEAL